MDPISAQSVLATAGAAAGDKTYVDDLFSTFAYYGNLGSSLTITNGIDLSGEGGLVWIKQRNGQREHHLFDTERGATKYLNSRQSTAEQTNTETLTGFTSSGFSLGDDGGVNHAEDFVSWTFRKAPGFFDIVTYTGNGGDYQTISHNLDSVPGMIIVKCTSHTSTNWTVYHREGHQPGIGNGSYYATFLDTDGAADASAAYWYNTEPTSTAFTVGVGDKVNGNGKTYVAYLFAHDDARFGTNEDESIIKCARYTGNSGSQAIDLGFEAQWVLIKRQQSSGTDWGIFDIIRGAGADYSLRLRPNQTNEEGSSGCGVISNGFLLFNGSSEVNTSGQRYIYMAIRRPNKPPEAATDVFALDATAASGTTANAFDASFPVDMVLMQRWGTGEVKYVGSRLMPQKNLYVNASNTQINSSFALYDKMDGAWRAFNSTEYSAQMFKRAPGFFDVVAYEGTSQNRTITHNLGATPELILVKGRDFSDAWQVYNKVSGATKFNTLRQYGDQTGSSRWNDTEPTSTVFTVGTDNGVNNSGYDYIAYLFATLDGISKVGSYTGTGNNIDVDCGFAAGARFVLIKRIDGGLSTSADWYLWDTAHGIVSGNDPYILLNEANAQVTGTDYIDPLNAGFTVTSSAPAALNTSGGTYLFLAIA